MAVLVDDTFIGPSLLSAHTADTGQPWVVDTGSGTVATGLTHTAYPGPGAGMSARTAVDEVSATGKFYVGANIEFSFAGSSDDGTSYAQFGVSDGPSGFVGISIQLFGDEAYWISADGAFEALPAFNNSATHVELMMDIGARTGSFSINGVVVLSGVMFSDLGPAVPSSAGVAVVMSSRIGCRITRLTLSDTPGGAPPVTGEFWTNIIRAVETP